jgi:hypothetical protein
MPDSSKITTLELRLRPPDHAAPDIYPVDVTLDSTGTFTVGVKLQPGALTALESSPWEYGRMLGQALFAGPELQRTIAYARARGARVSVSLQVDAPDLRDLLWESLILVTGTEELAFGASTTFTLSRRIPQQDAAAPGRDGAFRLLLVLASPKELDDQDERGPMGPIRVSDEIRSLRAALDAPVRRGLMQVSVLGRLPDADIESELLAAGYRVSNTPATLDAIADRLTSSDGLHLIAHGTFKNGLASLLLENDAGRAALVREQELLGRIGERSLRLVVLQACKSATREAGHANVMSGLAPKLTSRAAAVVAMQDLVAMDDARRFAQEFYDTLLGTGDVDRAVNAGRLMLYRPDSRAWAIPALYLAPGAEHLVEPDAVLTAVQDLAEQFAEKPDARAPFPIEVIHKFADVSSKMETSPPGPRVRVLEAVTSALFPEKPEDRSPVVALAGNYGRAKTAQLYMLYSHYAKQVSQDQPLPFFALMSEFPLTDDTPERLTAIAIAATYKRCGIEVHEKLIERRLRQPFILCLDGDQLADNRRRLTAFDAVRHLASSNPGASAVITVDEEQITHIPALNDPTAQPPIPVLLVQLLSPATVAQYLTQRGPAYETLLRSIQRANLFDVAGVPWLLAHLMRQPSRSGFSRSGVIARIVNGNFAAANLPVGIRRIAHELLGRIAWALQERQAVLLDGAALYETMEKVRGRREVQLEQLKELALDTKILAPSDEDGVRFSYPGFQSYWCAQHLLDSGAAFTPHLDNITATLGRRSRVRLWDDTLVLLAGMMPEPDRLIRRILAGSSMSHGEHAFLAARCIHEARLVHEATLVHEAASADHRIPGDVADQVLDSLIWRSTPMKESRGATRIRATECLALLRHPASIPHLISLAIERVRPTFNGQPTFELSGLRHAALQVLLTMREETDQYVNDWLQAKRGTAPPAAAALRALIDHWRACDVVRLTHMFENTTVPGLPAIVAFALGSIGHEDNLRYLVGQIQNPQAESDTLWSIADSLLLFDPVQVTRQAVAPMRANPALHAQAAYMIGRLRVATRGSEDARFLVSCLSSPDVTTRGLALKSLAQLGIDDFREVCECITRNTWGRAAKCGERAALRVYALESLRLIGNEDSLAAIREARNWRPQTGAADPEMHQLLQLSYEVSEDIYWRLTGGLEGDFYDPTERRARP